MNPIYLSVLLTGMALLSIQLSRQVYGVDLPESHISDDYGYANTLAPTDIQTSEIASMEMSPAIEIPDNKTWFNRSKDEHHPP